ncbi:MAG: hypothetical protein Q4D41_12555 [Prevotellaceae bacterium]|nr:hypothetical protein [Prevotellaceae bacterium]
MKQQQETVQRQNNTSAMATCSMCSGTGVFSAPGTQSTCSECSGTGRVTAQRSAELQQALQQVDAMTGGGGFDNTSIEYGNGGSSNSNSSNSSCNSCGGTGYCRHCMGSKVVEYDGNYGESGGYMKCPICKGSGKCGVCNGRGKI